MNRRQKIIISVTGIFLVALILVGLTYAYFLTQITGNSNPKSISVTTANLKLTYSDNSAEIINNGGAKLIPSTEMNASTRIGEKTFTVTNNGDDTEYVVIIENVIVKNATTNEITTFDSNDFVYDLICSNQYIDDKSYLMRVTKQTLPMSDGVLMGPLEIKSGDIHTCYLDVWYKDNGNQSSDMNKTLEARINIEDVNKINPYSNNTNSLAYNIINNALNITNENLNNKYAAYRKTPLTKPAEEISLEIESSLSQTPDDYTEETGFNSYYYRGNVQNNYVNYAGMCFRIVRIEGDGSIKLVLDDQYDECDELTDRDGDGKIYTGNSTLNPNYSSTYGYSEMKNIKGETIYQMNYLQPVNDASNSMVKAFYDFQINNLSNFTQKMKYGNWCLGDITTAYDEKGLPISDTVNNLKYNDTSFSYDAGVRLLGVGMLPTATLICNGVTLNKFSNVYDSDDNIIVKESNMYVSALTADEITFAGGKINDSNTKFFLINQIGDGAEAFWSLTPFSGGHYDMVFELFTSGAFTTNDVTNIAFDRPGYRPVISLIPGIELASDSGNGTQMNPYKVK